MERFRCFNEILVHKVYTYLRDIKEGMTVLDVGSGADGTFSIYAAHKGANKVYAIEPQPNRYQQQNKNIHKFGLKDKIISLQLGLWFKNTTLHIKKIRTNPEGSHVKAITLDNLVEKYGIPKIDFIKIDTEGCELPILAGAKKTITRDHPIFSIAGYHHSHFTANGQFKEKSEKNQMPTIIKLFKENHPEYRYLKKPSGWGNGEIITFYVE